MPTTLVLLLLAAVPAVSPAGVRSTRALAALVCVDASAALSLPGVVGCLTAADVPGANVVFGAPLLAGEQLMFGGGGSEGQQGWGRGDRKHGA
jgi:xanthine dehydrogenase molybdopterin-binding subunit B